jgi:hypothetical protein
LTRLSKMSETERLRTLRERVLGFVEDKERELNTIKAEKLMGMTLEEFEKYKPTLKVEEEMFDKIEVDKFLELLDKISQLFDQAIGDAEVRDSLLNQLLLEHNFKNKGGLRK